MRRELARTLGVRLGPAAGPAAEAWAIINRDLRGLQARTHRLAERVSPFARNNTWVEIVQRTARRLGVDPCVLTSVREVERRIFERVAEVAVSRLPREELRELDRLSEASPGFYLALSALRISKNGVRFVLTGLSHLAALAGTGTRAGSLQLGHWLNRRIHAVSLPPSVTRGLALVDALCRALVVAWRNLPVLRDIGPRNWRVIATVLAAIHFQSVLAEDLEDYRFARI